MLERLLRESGPTIHLLSRYGRIQTSDLPRMKGPLYRAELHSVKMLPPLHLEGWLLTYDKSRTVEYT